MARCLGSPAAQTPSRYRFLVLALIMSVQTAANVGALGLPSLAPLIRADFGLSRQEAGSFISAFYVDGVLTSFPAGWLADRVGVRWTRDCRAAGGVGGAQADGGEMMRAWCTVALVVLASCGGGDHAVLLHAPFIQNLSVTVLTPLVEGQRGVYRFRVDFTDPDGDLDGGSCEIDTTIGSAQLPLTFAQGSDPEATFGTIVCVFETIVLGRVVSGQFTVTDRHGLTSNAIGFTLPAERRRSERPASSPNRVS